MSTTFGEVKAFREEFKVFRDKVINRADSGGWGNWARDHSIVGESLDVTVHLHVSPEAADDPQMYAQRTLVADWLTCRMGFFVDLTTTPTSGTWNDVTPVVQRLDSQVIALELAEAAEVRRAFWDSTCNEVAFRGTYPWLHRREDIQSALTDAMSVLTVECIAVTGAGHSLDMAMRLARAGVTLAEYDSMPVHMRDETIAVMAALQR